MNKTYLLRLTCTSYLENHVKFKINIIDFWGSLHHCADYQMPPTEQLSARGLCSAQMCIIKEIDLFNSLLTKRSIFSFPFYLLVH